MSGRASVAVIGGGIVGTSAAYHLSDYPGVEVTAYEQGRVGGETTDASMAHTAGVDLPVRHSLAPVLELRPLEPLLPSLADAEEVVERLAVGSRTPDAWPVVGWTGVPGFSVAAFHSQGIQLAPAVGDVIARQLPEGDPTDYYGSASISRFDGYDDLRTHLDS